MALVTLREVCDYADKRGTAVGLFNVANLEFAEAIIVAAEQLNEPVILGLPERFFQFYRLENIIKLCIEMARCATVPVVVHIDHGKDFDLLLKAIRFGVSSVMFDGSTLPFQENVAKTAEIVRIAHAVGVSVEGELGYVGRACDDFGIMDDKLFTKPPQAVEFVEETGVDALAVAFGTVHGVYKRKPNLNFALLQEIHNCVPVPLVMHGGSGLTKAEFQKAIRSGIRKINVYTEISRAVMDKVADAIPVCPGWIEVTQVIRDVVEERVSHHMAMFSQLDEL